MGVALGICILMLIGVWLGRQLGMPRLNVISAFAASWIVMLLSATILGGVTDLIVGFTWMIILIGWLSLTIGAVLGWHFGKTRGRSKPPIMIDLRRTTRFHLLFTALFAIYLTTQLASALPLIQAAGGWSAILELGANSYRSASLQQSLEVSQTDLSGGLLRSIVNYATFVPGMVSTYTGAILWRFGRRTLALVPIILNGMLSLLMMQRTSIVLAVLLFVIGLIVLSQSQVGIDPSSPEGYSTGWQHTAGPSRPRRPGWFRGLVASATLFGIVGGFLFLTTTARTSGDNGLFRRAVGDYLVGGFAGLNARASAGPDWPPLPSDTPGLFDPSPGMGGYTFTGLWTVLARLGVPVETTRVNLDFTQVTLFGEATLTNVATAFGEFYLDFRMTGVIVLTFLLGFVASSLQAKLVSSQRTPLVPAVAFFLTFSFWSFFVAWTSDFRQLLLAAFGGAILTWAVRSRTAEGTAVPAGSLTVTEAQTHRRRV